MIDLILIKTKLAELIPDCPCNEGQKLELLSLVEKIKIPDNQKINPIKAIKLIKDGIKAADHFELKYLEYGGNSEKIREIEDQIIKDLTELPLDIKKLGQITAKLKGN